MLVKEIMTKEIPTVKRGVSVVEAAREMTKRKTKFLIITEKGKLAGIVTEWDFVTKLLAKSKDPAKTKIDDIMTKKVIVVAPDMEIEEAAKIMSKYNIKKLPVVTGGALVGVVTAMDIIAAEPKVIDQISELVLTTRKEKFVAG
ncbi:MAG: CBS domain-containing protein [Candidatus Aenigmarchaeota archaeon]|nr:CBS domain-containing protein [Candidatus Aenigmarchaeota archaeon]